MSFRVSGKNIEIGEALRERINARVLESLAKYFDGGFSGHATVSKEAFGFRTECVVHLDSRIVLRADAMAADPYSSADQAAERLDKRLRRYHRRLKDYRADAGNGASPVAQDDKITAPSREGEDAADAAPGPAVIAESPSALRRLSVSEAVMELDMTSVPVMVFRHAGHGRVNLVYRRADGDVGWIDPAADLAIAPAGGH
jgi:ribosomal subunit interface protein